MSTTGLSSRKMQDPDVIQARDRVINLLEGSRATLQYVDASNYAGKVSSSIITSSNKYCGVYIDSGANLNYCEVEFFTVNDPTKREADDPSSKNKFYRVPLTSIDPECLKGIVESVTSGNNTYSDVHKNVKEVVKMAYSIHLYTKPMRQLLLRQEPPPGEFEIGFEMFKNNSIINFQTRAQATEFLTALNSLIKKLQTDA